MLHYYGAGGWGIQWGETYLLTAPYFSNHGLGSIVASEALPPMKLTPREGAVRAGLAGTPIAQTQAILIGHGHIDHVGDVPALFGEGLIESKPALIADQSTTNELAALASRFGCIESIDSSGDGRPAVKCPLPRVRITPLHHAHAPNLRLAGQDVGFYGGSVERPSSVLPGHPTDFKVGETWGFLIDLSSGIGRIFFNLDRASSATPECARRERPRSVHRTG